ncbi:MAG: TlpA family protein disulfide reductase [Psychrobium sp.]
MKYFKWILALILVGIVCAIVFSPSIRLELGLMSSEDREHYTIHNGDIGKPIKTDLNIKDIDGNAFDFSQLKDKRYFVVLASKGCPGCNFLVRDYKANKTVKSAPIFVLYFDKLSDKIIQDSKINYLLTKGNRSFTYFNSVFTPTVYEINKQGIVTDKFIGYNDENAHRITQ